MVTISDCFIGNFLVTQGFGVNPDAYKQFGLLGHDGIDFGCPSNTPVIAATDGIIVKQAFDKPGYGNYVEIWDDKQNCMTLYGHLDHATVVLNQRVVKGELIGLSDNTGNSTGPHLHFGFGLTDNKGIRLNQNNGFSGWLNPDVVAKWEILNPSIPVNPPMGSTVSPDTYKGLDLTNRDSMKVAVDVWDAVVNQKKYISIDQYNTDVVAKDTTISNLNSTISTDETAIKTKQAQIDAFPALQDTFKAQIDALKLQADQLPSVQNQLSQALKDRDICLTAQSGQNSKISNLLLQITNLEKTINAGRPKTWQERLKYVLGI